MIIRIEDVIEAGIVLVGTVAQVGYKVGERILRPARVIVKQPPAK